MKDIKAEFKRKAQREPERHYPVATLKEEGFERRRCANCGGYFWSSAERSVCGEPACSGGYTFIGDTPAKARMDYIETWKRFAGLFERFGYTPIPRYPVMARWRDDTDFVQASIYDFQPYCVSGEVDPPANPLVVPQFCLRFNDIDNVGITGRHYTGFVMIGQHAFEPPEKYRPEEYLRHIYAWLVEGMRIPKDELQFHEDAWAGGGNLGPSMEYFSRGLEIGNQVYMQYAVVNSSIRELAIKVLDMGMGQERPAWFTNATSTSYEATFPTVIKELRGRTGVRMDEELVKKFLPFSGILNVEERGADAVWEDISRRMGADAKELREQILPLAGLYSVADHSRSLLLAIADGGLPSNVGGGYNLRVLVRRCLDIIARYGWNVSLPDVCEWHARYLKLQYPELMDALEEVRVILEVERKKYEETKRKSRLIVSKLKGGRISVEKLVELYDSQGISPEMLVEEGVKIRIPEDFYARVAKRHERAEHAAKTLKEKEFDTAGLPRTNILYYDDYALVDFSARVLRIMEGEYVVLDRTAFYPTSGGQIHDIGYIDKCRVVEVFKQGNVVIHRVKSPTFTEGDEVRCHIDWARRRQLAQHHTATHIVNGVARELLGEHIWQAGAEKTEEKARLDITHYESLSKEQLEEIERRANEIVARDMEVESTVLRRDRAEARFGFRLYQGGAVPGSEVRVVNIGGLDIEACGGTHLHRTGEAEGISIRGSTKIQDGIVRLEYYAGEAARRFKEKEKEVVESLRELATDAFRAAMGDGRLIISEGEWIIDERGLAEAAAVFSIAPQDLERALQRFSGEIAEDSAEIARLSKELGRLPAAREAPADVRKIQVFCDFILNVWKGQKKELERLRSEAAALRVAELAKFEAMGKLEVLIADAPGKMDDLVKMAGGMLGKNRVVVLFGVDEGISVVAMRGVGVGIDMSELVSGAAKILGGGGGGKPDFARGAGRDKGKLAAAKAWVRSRLAELSGKK